MKKKIGFSGKIRTDPGESLAKGHREVMAAIWREYLQEVCGASPKSGRFRVLREAIEAAGNFAQVYEEWNDLPPEDRAAAWRRLIQAVKSELEARSRQCVRCGECCERSSPTLLTADTALLESEAISFGEVYTLRAGEKATDRDGAVVTLKEERLKVREVPGTRQCWFYRAADRACRLYEQRPEQCRRQQCWEEPHPEPAPEEVLQRRHLFTRVPEVWELIQAHEERCGVERLAQVLAQVAAGEEEAGDHLFTALHFDHYLREMLVDEWGLSPATTELLLGRPLKSLLRDWGYRATLTPEGVFRLSPMCEVPDTP
ncbi:MAG: YkgJ family cysteine cluster protein [Deltaproteobacteria bacterium]|nr:YkgJ family cysteine cluster protein [Deltaproteobacteria bacterium]MBM4285771.1 YkgJ family cysteine cluster protein [Deltaproteobacteria bacterium]